MKSQDLTKSFAFKLASTAQPKAGGQHAWQVRDRVAVAGCSGPFARSWSPVAGVDRGLYC
jgi:hypothetical protein